MYVNYYNQRYFFFPNDPIGKSVIHTYVFSFTVASKIHVVYFYMYCSDTTFLILSQNYLFTTETSVYQILKTDKPVHKAISEEKKMFYAF